jgi:hypothetical protein
MNKFQFQVNADVIYSLAILESLLMLQNFILRTCTKSPDKFFFFTANLIRITTQLKAQEIPGLLKKYIDCL